MKKKKKLKKIGQVTKLVFEEMGLKVVYFSVNKKQKYVACYGKFIDLQIYIERGKVVPTIYCGVVCGKEHYFWERDEFDFKDLSSVIMDALVDRKEVKKRYRAGDHSTRMFVGDYCWRARQKNEA